LTVRLWDESLEQHREAERAANAAMAEAYRGLSDPPAGLWERVAFVREQFAATWDATVTRDELSTLSEGRSIRGPTGDIPVLVYRPPGPVQGLFLRIHGGGFFTGWPIMDDHVADRLAREHGLVVVSPDYRLAPEHPYPAGPDDCEATAAWMLEHGASELGADRLFVGGESAGGHLAAVTALRIRDRLGAIDHVLGCVLTSGIYDLRGTPSQRGNGGRADVLDPDSTRFMSECLLYGLDDALRNDPDVSPLLADLRRMCPALISAGTADHLLDDALFLAARWAAAESPCELGVYPDASHALPVLGSEMSRIFTVTMDRFLASHLHHG
jgi:acetyl esterase/lipase